MTSKCFQGQIILAFNKKDKLVGVILKKNLIKSCKKFKYSYFNLPKIFIKKNYYLLIVKLFNYFILSKTNNILVIFKTKKLILFDY